eukprot:Clim_evm2s113 gene=Clim_evmTU2s113
MWKFSAIVALIAGISVEASSVANLEAKDSELAIPDHEEVFEHVDMSAVQAHTVSTRAATCLDKFGIQQFHPSVDSTDWYADWDASRSMDRPGRWDPYDDRCLTSGTGNWSFANGIFTMDGWQPRFQVYNEAKNWWNVEFTAYAKLAGSFGSTTYSGITMVARSRHNDRAATPCNARGYHARLYFHDNTLRIQKEFYHDSSKSRYTNSQIVNTNVNYRNWIGIKFIIKTNSDNRSNTLQVYLDETEGRNGGDWKLHLEYVDDGDWPVVVSDFSCGYDFSIPSGLTDKNTPVLGTGYVNFFRSDDVTNLQWKWASMRNIDPNSDECGSDDGGNDDGGNDDGGNDDGGKCLNTYTAKDTGNSCWWDKNNKDCASCQNGGCQCGDSGKPEWGHVCVKCGDHDSCDGAYKDWKDGCGDDSDDSDSCSLNDYTKSNNGGRCWFDTTSTACAQCQNGGCQCGNKSTPSAGKVCVKCGDGGACGAAAAGC